MKIQAVTPIVNFRAQNSRRTIQNNKSGTPFRDGLSTAGAWFSFGVGLDFISRKFQFSKSPLKNSLALNGIKFLPEMNRFLCNSLCRPD